MIHFCHLSSTLFLTILVKFASLLKAVLRDPTVAYALEGTVLENVDCIKYLGVTLATYDLRWNNVSVTFLQKRTECLKRSLKACLLDVNEIDGLERPVPENAYSVWNLQIQ